MPPYIAPELKQRIGVWGPPTSTLDWCERNYISTLFIAELWNSLSSLVFVVLSSVGLWYTLKYNCELRYVLCYVGLLIVGVGSFLFHATLKLSMQLLDEIPMLILAALMLFTLQEMGGVRGVYTSWTYIKSFFVLAYTSTVTLVYIIVNDPTFHEISYALMVVLIAYLGFRNLGKYGKWKYLTFALTSFLTYSFAFVVWNIDNRFCPSIREFRSIHPMFGALSQFHAWWHCLTATGTYMHLVCSSRLRMEHLGHPCHMKFVFGVIPYIEVLQRRP